MQPNNHCSVLDSQPRLWIRVPVSTVLTKSVVVKRVQSLHLLSIYLYLSIYIYLTTYISIYPSMYMFHRKHKVKQYFRPSSLLHLCLSLLIQSNFKNISIAKSSSSTLTCISRITQGPVYDSLRMRVRNVLKYLLYYSNFRYGEALQSVFYHYKWL